MTKNIHDPAWWLALLQAGFDHYKEDGPHRGEETASGWEFLSDRIFDFVTYDDSVDRVFAQRAVEFIRSVTERNTFAVIDQSEAHYLWWLMMPNVVFFENTLNWGTSIRGAWWDVDKRRTKFADCTGLVNDQGKQELMIEVDTDGWKAFMQAILQFADTLPKETA